VRVGGETAWFAMKRTSSHRKSSRRELHMLQRISHRSDGDDAGAGFVVGLKMFFASKSSLNLLMEFVPHGSLFHELQRRQQGSP
jgi:serine/threonine protein kinase